VVIDKAITVQSVNGPVVTMIRGAFQPGGTNGNAAIRCVWMTNNAVLVGFTLTNGATRASDYGGGVWCQSTAAYISNCFILGNAADAEGGGVLFGSLQFCTLAGNAASLGGGASGSQLTLCNVTSNRASVGGGVLLGTLALCQLFGNQATTFGGGVSGGTLDQLHAARKRERQPGRRRLCRHAEQLLGPAEFGRVRRRRRARAPSINAT
jgi:hypothetical protein